MDIRQTIERLCGSGAPSGFEGPAAAAARELLEPLMDQVWTDRLGIFLRFGQKELEHRL